MTRHSDHPLLRRELSCPICSGYKGAGKVMCSPCHVELECGSDDERDYTEGQLDAAEQKLEMEETWGIW